MSRLKSPFVMAVGSEDQRRIEEAALGLMCSGEPPIECKGGAAIVFAGERRTELLHPGSAVHEVIAFATIPGMSELAVRACVSTRHGCQPYTCGAAVLRFTELGALMVGKGSLERPRMLRGALTNTREGIALERVFNASAYGQGFAVAHHILARGHTIGSVPGEYFADTPAMHVLAEATNSLKTATPTELHPLTV